MAPLILHSCVNKSSKILLIAFHNLGIAARVVGGGGGGGSNLHEKSKKFGREVKF